MASIFTKLIQGEIPSYKIAEDENFFAFLDINPIAKGHTLVVPKQEIDYIYDLEDDTLTGLHLYCKKIALALKKAITCERVSIIVAGFEVPHAHVHLIPSHTMEDLNFNNKKKFSPEEMAAIASSIQAQL